jgi:hypothetical protein
MTGFEPRCVQTFFLHIDDRVRTQLRPDFFSSHWNVKTRSLDAAGFECEEKNVWTHRGSNPVITAAKRGPIPRIPKKKVWTQRDSNNVKEKKVWTQRGSNPVITGVERGHIAT